MRISLLSLPLFSFQLACNQTPAGTSDSTNNLLTVVQPNSVAGQDVWITSVFSYNDAFGVDDEKLQVGGWADEYYSLLKFDLAGLPRQAAAATIVLQPFNRGDASTLVPMTLYRVTGPWDEATGWFNQPSAEFISTLPTPVTGVAYSIDVTGLYNAWKSGQLPNYGIELRPTANNNRFNVFRSSDYQHDASQRPKLVIMRGANTAADHFTWPTDPLNASTGFYASCGENPQCFWLNADGWRDVQPFLRYQHVDENGRVYGYHLGADWNLGVGAMDKGMPVYAIADGIVVDVQSNVPEWGNVVFVRHTTSFGVYTSMYAHVDWAPTGPPSLARIRKGQQIAIVGNGNGKYGYHLHLEIRSGASTTVGPGYVSTQGTQPPQGQVDPNAFIAAHR